MAPAFTWAMMSASVFSSDDLGALLVLVEVDVGRVVERVTLRVAHQEHVDLPQQNVAGTAGHGLARRKALPWAPRAR